MPAAYVVVDGSNIATEGRSVPSLAQLEGAVRALADEMTDETEIIVVVDASFGHRIDPSEQAAFQDAVSRGELTSPPAGAIGRGDAFLLRIAERVGARVLSNDSFQEFHAEHPWLFEEGRLLGGKPVTGIGWIFTPRRPVRGPRSRAAVSAAKRGQDTADPDAVPVQAQKAASAAKSRSRRKTPEAEPPPAAVVEADRAPAPKRRRRRRKADDKEVLAAIEVATEEAIAGPPPPPEAAAELIREWPPPPERHAGCRE